MKIEWDEAKRQWTLEARGLDFASIESFDWQGAVIFDDERHDYGETREVALGFIGDLFVAVAYTIRGGALRVISLRKANKRERKVYDRFQTIDRP